MERRAARGAGAAGIEIPGHRLGAPVGFGANGAVWSARDRAGRDVVVSVLPLAAGERGAAQLRRLADLRGLTHPHLARVVDVVGLDSRRCALVSERVPGPTLATVRAARGPAGPGELATLLACLGSALGYLHERGVVHGDVSPTNVVVAPGGVPVLVDLAGEVAHELGTDGFVPPERALGHAAGAAGDVWALARLVLWAGPDRPDERLGELLGAALDGDPARRPGARDLASTAPVLAAREALRVPPAPDLAQARLRAVDPATRRRPASRREARESVAALVGVAGGASGGTGGAGGGAGGAGGGVGGARGGAGRGAASREPPARAREPDRRRRGSRSRSLPVSERAAGRDGPAGTAPRPSPHRWLLVVGLLVAAGGIVVAGAHLEALEDGRAFPRASVPVAGPDGGALGDGTSPSGPPTAMDAPTATDPPDASPTGDGASSAPITDRTDVVQAFRTLVARRDGALMAADPAALAAVSVPGGPAAAADAALLAQLTGARSVVRHLRTEIVEVRSVTRGDGGAVVEAVLEQPPHERVVAGVSVTVPAQPQRCVRVTLDGPPWRVAETGPCR